MDDVKRGVEHFNAGRFEQARRCFAAGKDLQSRIFYGHVEAALGRRREAAAAFAAAIKAYPRALEPFEGLANLVLNMAPERDRSAEAALRRVLKVPAGPRLPAVLTACGNALRAAGDLDGAERVLARAVSPGALAEVVRLRGEAYLAAGDLDKAEKELKRVLKLEPGRKGVKRGLKRLLTRKSESSVAAVLRRRGIAMLSEGKLREAERTLRRAAGDKEARAQLAEVLRLRELERVNAESAKRLALAEKIRVLTEELIAAGQGTRSAVARRTEALLVKILKLDPGNARASFYAGANLLAAGSAARGRVLLAQALRGGLGAGDEFAALIKLGRTKAAIARAERALDRTPSVDDLRAFWDPWDWAELPKDERRALAASLPSEVWRRYYLCGIDENVSLPRSRRYAWMLAKSGHVALCEGDFQTAEADLRAALLYKTVDWRTRGYLAEVLLCTGRAQEGKAELVRAGSEAPLNEHGQAGAWLGAFHLWLGDYEAALGQFDEAARRGSAYALSWRGAALLKLGRAGEALEQLDAALKAYPRDLEAYVWRGEAKRALGRDREALADLSGDWLWARVNRALAKRALGDAAGFEADFAALPRHIIQYVRAKTGESEPARLLEKALELARGFRREEYAQAIWLT